MHGKLLIFSAPSGAGKTTIVQFLCRELAQISFSVSATTRQRRETEVDGQDYYFMAMPEFMHRIAKHEFVEFEEVYQGTYYGTLRAEIERVWAQGKHVIFDLDVQGGLRLKKKFGVDALSIFVKPPSVQILIDRLTKRATETPEKINERIQKASQELTHERDFDRVLLNDDLEKACETAKKWALEFFDS